VATAAGNANGAMAAGMWLRLRGTEFRHPHRVLQTGGFVADGFVAAGPGIPKDSVSARELLRREGVHLDEKGRASRAQRFTPEQWRRP
jgi:hypothetical protein